ncbi:MAG TPA: histidine kinase [Candidatus Aminicenantes bacterium]|nr:histidine kinase [Candidatus Aminicenantes bacterium]
MKTKGRQILNNWLLLWGAWTLFAIYFVSESMLYKSVNGIKVTIGPLVANYLAEGYLWALFTPVLFRLCKRYQVPAPRWFANTLKQLPWSLAITSLFILLYYWVKVGIHHLFDQGPMPLSLRGFYLRIFHVEYIFYWAIIIVIHLTLYRRQLKEREMRNSELERRLAQSQLQGLKMQLHPHFLFNTLNSIQTLVDSDSAAAKKMITRLSDFLRLTLHNSGASEIPLKEELDFIKNYLKICEIRFGDRLAVEFDVEPAALDATLPNLILQPLVENAIKHGVAPQARGGRIRIGARRSATFLSIQVEDDGPGPRNGDGGGQGQGLGLANVAGLLRHLYGENHRFVFGRGPRGGFLVELAIPQTPPK